MTERHVSVEVKSEARGSHWVAWVVGGPDGGKEDDVLVVGLTREEAEARARDRAVRPDSAGNRPQPASARS